MDERSPQPKYRSLSDRQMRQREEAARAVLASCTLCPRQCRVNRNQEGRGFCRAGSAVQVAHWQVHSGEEPPLSGAGGAGAIFFAGCPLACVFCQNYQISQESGDVPLIGGRQLAEIMLGLQHQGSQNIDLVSPTHYVPQIIAAVRIARREGLRIPLVYNSSGYESVPTLHLLRGIIDIYLPDFKYGSDLVAQRFSGVADYVSRAHAAISEMVEQTGPLRIDRRGRAWRGVIVRHLVLPQDQAHTGAVLDLLEHIGPQRIGLSLMSQYAPCYRAGAWPAVNRRLRPSEYTAALARAERIDFRECWIQELDSNTVYFPDFSGGEVFSTERATKERQ